MRAIGEDNPLTGACGQGVVAEGVGFEPTVPKGHNGFRDRPIRPLSHPSWWDARRKPAADRRFRLLPVGREERP